MPTYSSSDSSSSGAVMRAMKMPLIPIKEMGLLNKCYCGVQPIIETCQNQLNPGRRFYTCRHVADGECHVWKWWDVAVTEELNLIDENYGLVAEKMAAMTFNSNFYEAQEEVEKLKDAQLKNEEKIADLEMALVGIKRKKMGFDMKIMVTAVLVVLLGSIMILAK